LRRGCPCPTNGADIRVIDIYGTAWFPAKDVCDLLGLSKPANAVKDNCDSEDYRTVLQSELANARSTGLSFPNRGMTCVNETGIYDLIGASRKPAARAFRKWVNGTVLPAIRKDGGYVMGEEKFAAGEMSEDELIHEALQVAERKAARLKAENKGKQLGAVSNMVITVDRRTHAIPSHPSLRP
jgi:prophage antirepressor-like protein